MLPRLVSNNSPNGLYAGDDPCGSSSSGSNPQLHRHSITCLPSSSSGSTWFHGHMSQSEADHLLLNSTPGSFLVRRQDASRFFISVATISGVVEHYPVKRLGRQYFYNGNNYSSLSDLVSLIKERGGEPLCVSPFQSISSDSSEEKNCKRYITRLSFNGAPNSNELSASMGDVVTLIENIEFEWVAAVNNRTGQTGFIPLSILAPLFDGGEDIYKLPYIHGLEVSDLDEALQRMKISRGSFLIRPSSHGTGYWAIMVNVGNDQVKKFLIRQAHDKEGGWILAGRRFKSIPHIIERYCHFPILDNVKLCHAVLADLSPKHYSHSWSSPNTEIMEEVRQSVGKVKTIAPIEAFKKTREDKPWKPCILSIQDDTDGYSELILIEDGQKMKTAYRLPFCTLYSCDDSVFDREACFYLAQSDVESPGIFVSIQPYWKFAEWMCLLRSRVLALQPGSTPSFDGFHFNIPQSPPLCILRVYLDKYRCDMLKLDKAYSAQLTLNGIQVCNSPLLAPTIGKLNVPTVVFDSSFIIPFAPSVNAMIQVTVQQKGKTMRPIGMSSIISMPSSQLTSIVDNGLSLRVSHTKLAISGEEDYIMVEEWLETSPFEFLEYVADNLVSQDRTLFSLALVNRLYSKPQKLFCLIERLLIQVLSNATPENVLRQDSLATSILSQILRVCSRAQLEKELDNLSMTSSKFADSHDIEALIYTIISLCKNEMVYQVLSLVKKVAANRFSHESHVVRRVVSNVLILRFANPIILSKYNGLPIGQMIAKGIQSVANSACAKTTDADEFPHVKALRRAFEEISADYEPSSNIPECDNPNFEWLAISCHLMYTTLISTTEAVPHVPDNVRRVLLAHKPQN